MKSQLIYGKISKIPGWFSYEDVKGFQGLDLPNNPKIVECGTYCGRSATAFSIIWPGATIYTFDPVDEPQRVRGDWAFVNTKGIEATEWTAPIDLLFIDDSHYYDDIKANFDHFLPYVKSGGYVVFHDYWFESDDVEGVRRFVKELGNCDVTNQGMYGLAIWRKP